MDSDYVLKAIVIGDTTVGKSCFMLQFTNKTFVDFYDVTIGVEFGAKTLTVRNSSIKLQVWDTAGQENFRSITRSYYKSAICALVVYDTTRRSTFENVTQWMADLDEYAGRDISIILVGNKCDLTEKRNVATEEGKALAKKHSTKFIEASAKTGENVLEAFSQVTESFLDKITSGMINGEYYRPKLTQTGHLQKPQKAKKKKSCC